jgi:hypothetical protein
MYTAFIDFTQAYDHIPRAALWHHLEHNVKLPPPLLAAIQSLYEHDSYLVVDGWARSEPIQPNKGVKQGCPLSPLLFSLYINDVHTHLDKPFCGSLSVASRSVSHVLYADDLTLFARTQAGLQTLLDRLLPYAQSKHLTVNISKSKTMVFCPRDLTPPPPALTYDGQPLAAVTEFRYLGINLNQQASMTHAALSGLGGMHRAARQVLRMAAAEGVSNSPLAFLHLFQSFVLPHVMYGCQLWSTQFLRSHSPDMVTNNPLQRH